MSAGAASPGAVECWVSLRPQMVGLFLTSVEWVLPHV